MVQCAGDIRKSLLNSCFSRSGLSTEWSAISYVGMGSLVSVDAKWIPCTRILMGGRSQLNTVQIKITEAELAGKTLN